MPEIVSEELVELRATVQKLQHENAVFRHLNASLEDSAQRLYAAISQKDDLIKKLQDKIMLLDACRY